jgi:two-component system nitrogen regulation response regulator GlnG
VRELQSVLKQALLHAAGPVLVPEFLPPALHDEARAPEPASGTPALGDLDAFITGRLEAGSLDLYAEALALLERNLLTRVLRHTRGNQLQAAKVLGITRGSLRTKLRTLGIVIERSVWSENDQPE